MPHRLNIQEPIRRHLPPWWYRLKQRWPFLIWLLAIAGAGLLYFGGTRVGTTSGTVEAIRQEISPIETAPLKVLRVKVGDRVRAGDVIAEMDASILDADLTVLKLDAERQFMDSVARIESDLRSTRLQEAETRGEHEVLAAELARMEDLLEKRLVDAASVAEVRARERALARALEIFPDTLAQIEKNLAETRERALASSASMGDSKQLEELALHSPAVRDGLAFLQRRRESYILRAIRDGIVSEIFHRPGNVVPAGMPIATLVEEKAALVIAFLPETMAREVSVGMEAYLTHTALLGSVVRARIVALSPEILGLPTRINPVPGRTYRGRRIVIEPLEENDFFPGESLNVQFERPFFELLMERLFRRAPSERRPPPA